MVMSKRCEGGVTSQPVVIREHAHAQRFERGFTSLSAMVRAQQPRDAFPAQRDFQAARQASSCDDVHGPGLAAGDLQQQLRGALHRALLVHRIHAALERWPASVTRP